MQRIGFSLVLAATLAASIVAARAEFKVLSPIIEYRELEFEHNGDTTFDKANNGKSNNQSYTNEVEYGVTPWWKPGLEFEMEAAPGENWKYSATTWENFFQLTEQGKYWADLGFFAEYSHAQIRTDADDITFGPLVQKEWNDPLGFGINTLHTLNVLFTKQIGRNRNDATPVAVNWQSLVRVSPFLSPGIEFYGRYNNIADRNTLSGPTNRAGPVIVGAYNMYQYGKLKYEVGYLVGLNDATERGTVRWRLEYEKSF